MAFAGIRGGNDDADGFLVEAFEATVALEVFEMAADCAFGHEFFHLLFGDEPRGKQTLGAFAAEWPAFAFGKGLAKKFEIGEGFHGVDAAAFELIAEEIEIEPRFEVVNPGFKKTLAMQADPETDGAEARSRRKFLSGEIDLGFFGHKVDVSEHNDADTGLL